MKEEAWQTAEREPDLPVISHKPWQAENLNFLLRQIDVCHCSCPFYLAKKLWYTPFGTLLEFFTCLIIHSPLCSPAWFMRCTSSIAIFSQQTVHIHCVSQNSFFSITFFSSSFSPWNHFMFPLWDDDDDFRLFTCLIHSTSHTPPPLPPKSKKDWKDDFTTLLLDLLEKKLFCQ